MLKNVTVLVFCFLFSSTGFTQIQSGGGPDDDLVKKLEPMTTQYKSLITAINKNWQKCGNNPALKFNLLSEAYLQLTWKNSSSDCSEEARKTILTCFYDDKMKFEINTFFLHSEKAKTYLGLIEDKEYVDIISDYLKEAAKK